MSNCPPQHLLRPAEYQRFHLLFLLPLLCFLSACAPKIQQFRVWPLTAGPGDPIHISWRVKGQATLLIRDVVYPGSGTSPLADVTLRVTRHGQEQLYTLHADSTIRIALEACDSLLVQKKPDQVSDDRLRYLTLVAAKSTKEADSVAQVSIRPDAASDVIAFRTVIRGDSLIAEGINNPVRWGNNFNILTAASGSSRVLIVTHHGGSADIPVTPPANTFQGTPVSGYWSFRAPMTAAEKSNHQLVPEFLKLTITLKHH